MTFNETKIRMVMRLHGITRKAAISELAEMRALHNKAAADEDARKAAEAERLKAAREKFLRHSQMRKIAAEISA